MAIKIIENNQIRFGEDRLIINANRYFYSEISRIRMRDNDDPAFIFDYEKEKVELPAKTMDDKLWLFREFKKVRDAGLTKDVPAKKGKDVTPQEEQSRGHEEEPKEETRSGIYELDPEEETCVPIPQKDIPVHVKAEEGEAVLSEETEETDEPDIMGVIQEKIMPTEEALEGPVEIVKEDIPEDPLSGEKTRTDEEQENILAEFDNSIDTKDDREDNIWEKYFEDSKEEQGQKEESPETKSDSNEDYTFTEEEAESLVQEIFEKNDIVNVSIPLPETDSGFLDEQSENEERLKIDVRDILSENEEERYTADIDAKPEPDARDVSENEGSPEMVNEEENKKKGFFGKLFGKK